MRDKVASTLSDGDAQAFGRAIVGPIFAEFSLRLWAFLRFVAEPDRTSLLFCARGGLRLKAMFERFLERTGLESPVTPQDLMVSRLVAARAQAITAGPALLDELGREFEGRPMAQIARALAQEDLPLEAEWDTVFAPATFIRLLQGDGSGARLLRSRIEEQNALFREHLGERAGGCRTIVLCDTGLYGSTVRLLREAISDRRWLCAQFARSNYKGFATPHFGCTIGLSVEQDGYSPLNTRSAVLRFWQLIEAVLEPPLPSVRSFERIDGTVRSNLEEPGWVERIAAPSPSLYAGAFAYLDDLDRSALRRIGADAERAWRELRRAIVRPTATDLAILSLADRGRDFGRQESVPQYAGGTGAAGSLARLKESLWREGEIARSYPTLGPVLLTGLEAAHAARSMRRAWKGMRQRGAQPDGSAPGPDGSHAVAGERR